MGNTGLRRRRQPRNTDLQIKGLRTRAVIGGCEAWVRPRRAGRYWGGSRVWKMALPAGSFRGVSGCRLRNGLDGSKSPGGKTSGEVPRLLGKVLHERVKPQRAWGQRQERIHEQGRLLAEVVPLADAEPRRLDGGTQLVGRGEVAELGTVGPWKRIAEFTRGAAGDVPDRESATGDQYPACFAVEA